MKKIKDYWNKPIHKRYKEGLDMKQFKRISDISSYNSNYYVGFDNGLLFAQSDDDNTTEWYLIRGVGLYTYLGVSHTSDRDKLIHEPNT